MTTAALFRRYRAVAYEARLELAASDGGNELRRRCTERRRGRGALIVHDDYLAITDTVYCYATGLDLRDWALYRSIFTEEVDMDFSAWDQVPPYRIRADDLTENVRVYFAGLDATQHSMTNPRVRIEGDKARCIVYMQAEHFLEDQQPSRRFVIGGYYADDLVRTADGWKLCAVKLSVLWTRGDRGFMLDAAERGRRRLRQP